MYANISLVNYHLQEMIAMDRSGGRGGAFAATENDVRSLHQVLNEIVPRAKDALDAALGRGEG